MSDSTKRWQTFNPIIDDASLDLMNARAMIVSSDDLSRILWNGPPRTLSRARPSPGLFPTPDQWEIEKQRSPIYQPPRRDPNATRALRVDLDIKRRKQLTSSDSEPLLFRVTDVLSLNECAYLISKATPHFQSLDHLYEQHQRVSSRAMFRSPIVAQQLYQRIRPLLKNDDFVHRPTGKARSAIRSPSRIPPCFDNDGVWMPLCINECLKVVKYEKGGHLSPHRDGPWVPREDQCSMLTMVFYLDDSKIFNDGDVNELGGTTRFISENDASEFFDISPRAGSAIVFEHHLLHGSNPITAQSGCKYILRCEMIFQRVASFVPRTLRNETYTKLPEYVECRRLYDESQACMLEGDRAGFSEKYERVLALQIGAMEHALRTRRQQLVEARGRHGVDTLTRFNDDELASILGFLVDKDLVQVMRLSQATWYRLHLAPIVWESRCIERFGREVCSRAARANGALRGDEGSDDRQAMPKSAPFTQPSACWRDWRTFYIMRVTLQNKHRFNPIVVQATASRVFVAISKDLQEFAPFFAPPYNAYHLSMEDEERFEMHAFQDSQEFDEDTDDWVVDPRRQRGFIAWSVLAPALTSPYHPTLHPLAIVAHPSWFCEAASPMRRDSASAAEPSLPASVAPTTQWHIEYNATSLFNLCRTPAIRFFHPAQLAVEAAVKKHASTTSATHSSSSSSGTASYVVVIEWQKEGCNSPNLWGCGYTFVVSPSCLALVQEQESAHDDDDDGFLQRCFGMRLDDDTVLPDPSTMLESCSVRWILVRLNEAGGDREPKNASIFRDRRLEIASRLGWKDQCNGATQDEEEGDGWFCHLSDLDLMGAAMEKAMQPEFRERCIFRP